MTYDDSDEFDNQLQFFANDPELMARYLPTESSQDVSDDEDPPQFNHHTPPPFPPLPNATEFTAFRSLDIASAIIDSLDDLNNCYIAIPIQFITSIRNDRRRARIHGYIIHH